MTKFTIDELLAVLRTGCFKYFECGGECINGPVSLLSGIAPSVLLLAYHFFAVAFYSIWVMFTHPRVISQPGEKPVYAIPSLDQYPFLLVKSVQVVRIIIYFLSVQCLIIGFSSGKHV